MDGDRQYDDTNRGVYFAAREGDGVAGTGRLNIGGQDLSIAVLWRPDQNGEPVREVYVRVGRLYDNDKKGNEKAPDFSGPIEWLGQKLRLAGWIKSSNKTGAKFVSLNVEASKAAPRGDPALDGGLDAGQMSGPLTGGYSLDDEIPF